MTAREREARARAYIEGMGVVPEHWDDAVSVLFDRQGPVGYIYRHQNLDGIQVMEVLSPVLEGTVVAHGQGTAKVWGAMARAKLWFVCLVPTWDKTGWKITNSGRC